MDGAVTLAYSTFDTPVRGGLLRVGQWAPSHDLPAVLAVHGVTASHLSWAMVADALPEARLVAPDLRGRGRSNTLPGPWGMAQHSDDLVAVLDHLGVESAVLVGHSMGAFAAVVAAHRYPDRFSEVLLIDGGLPLVLPAGATTEDTLGPAAARLSMTFGSREIYRQFWKQHPAFLDQWSAAVEAYADYDLEGEAPELHPSTSFDAVAADSRELTGGEPVNAALAELSPPTRLLTAPRGLLDEIPGLYSQADVARWRSALPQVTITPLDDLNHYTIVMSERGAALVADELRAAVARSG